MKGVTAFVASAALGAVLLVASEAAGACAWVLWMEARDQKIPHDSFLTKDECDAARDRIEERDRAAWKRWEERGRIGSRPAVVYVTCFPDTIDPRAPKGGDRR